MADDQDEKKQQLPIAPPNAPLAAASQATPVPTIAPPGAPLPATPPQMAANASAPQLPGIAPPTALPAPAMPNPVAPPGMPQNSRIPALPPPQIQSGGARLWQAAGNIQNPVLRTLAKVGTGVARAGEIAGEALVPRVAELIPGSEINTRQQNAGNEAQFERREQLDTQREGVEQKPESAEEQGELRGQIKAQGDADAAARQQATLKQQADLAAQREKDAEASRTQTIGAAQARQDALLAHQDEMEGTREAAADKRLQETLPSKEDAANDKGYQFNSTQLEKVRTPIDALANRMSTLTQNTNFHTPQADSLLAPEILSVVAGGTGSGLRMNQAELERISNGSTKWTQLQTALNKWSTDPQHATFTDEQRNQMRQIVGAVQSKVTAQQKILEDGEQKLIDAKDRTEQRQVVANTRKLIDAVNNGKKLVRVNGEIKVAE